MLNWLSSVFSLFRNVVAHLAYATGLPRAYSSAHLRKAMRVLIADAKCNGRSISALDALGKVRKGNGLLAAVLMLNTKYLVLFFDIDVSPAELQSAKASVCDIVEPIHINVLKQHPPPNGFVHLVQMLDAVANEKLRFVDTLLDEPEFLGAVPSTHVIVFPFLSLLILDHWFRFATTRPSQREIAGERD